MAGESEQANPIPPARKGSRKGQRRQTPWREDLIILARLPLVERHHLGGKTNVAIAQILGVDEGTVRADLDRLREIWLERIGEQQQVMRAAIVAELNDVRARAIDAAEWDAFCERAVLFDDPTMPDYEMKKFGLDPNLRVSRDEKGSATFRGQKAQALNVARQATMDKAKALGLIVDQLALSKDMQREAEKVAAELGLDPESKAKLIDFASRKKAS